MARTPATWQIVTLRVLLIVFGAALVAQYFLGLWTNAYAPEGGFTTNTSMPSLDWHYTVGYLLGILAILILVIAALSRRLGFVVAAVVMLAAVAGAGVAGMMFVRSMPNDPTFTIVMGLLFLIAFAATTALSILLRGSRPSPMPWQPSGAPPA